MTRRQLLIVGGGIAAVAAGWFFFLDGGGGGGAGDTPTGTARAFVNALDDGDAQRATELHHPDSPVPQSVIQDLAQRYSGIDTGVDSMVVTEQSGRQATVEVTLRLQEETASMRIKLRKSNDSWRVYSFPGPA